MVLRIAFYKGFGLRRDRFIKWWTKSSYSHVELILPDGRSLGIRPPEFPRVRMSESQKFPDKDWDFIDFDITDNQFKNIIEFWTLTKDHKYDWIGMVLSHILKVRVKTISKWYCSEWVAQALIAAKVVDLNTMIKFNKAGIPPGDLYNMLRTIKV